MRSIEVWTHRPSSEDASNTTSSPVYAVCWHPEAHIVFVAQSCTILVYDAAKGEPLQTLKAHRDTIYAMDATDTRLFSGGADKTVVVWSLQGNTYTATLRYSHDASIQSIASNIISGSVCSTTAIDFGLWSQETKAVTKFKMNSKVTCSSWSKNGEYLALGTYAGTVSIRNKLGDELVLIERNSDAPIWSVQWNPSAPKPLKKNLTKEMTSENMFLVVTDWQPSVTLYHHSGRQIVRDRSLTWTFGDPLSLSHFFNGECFIVSGTAGKVSLWNAEGIYIGEVLERPHHWIWSCQLSPKSGHFLVGTHDGQVYLYQILFNTVHGLHRDRYVFREGLTDVLIQDFSSSKSCRISCRDYVKKVAIYEDKVAVQLSSKVLIYQMATIPGSDSLEYSLHYKIPFQLHCNLMVVTSKHVLFCMDCVLDMYTTEGILERQWKLDSFIRYIKVVGGPSGREMLFVGTREGWTYKILVDHSFPIPLVKQTSPIRCIDMNRRRTKLAVVDDTDTCFVYELKPQTSTTTKHSHTKGSITHSNMHSHLGGSIKDPTQLSSSHEPTLPSSMESATLYTLLYQEPQANSVAWNTDHDDLIAFSGKQGISLKASTFPPILRPLSGFVVGFTGPKLYCLCQYQMTIVDVPLNTCMYQYLERRDLIQAYETAMLGGVSEKEWRSLGFEALKDQAYFMAKTCFKKVNDTRILTALDLILHQALPEKPLLGDILALNGQWKAAEEAFVTSGHPERALQLYMDLSLYEEALQVAKAHRLDTAAILKQKASFLADQQDLETAAETYLQVGDFSQAMRLFIQKGSIDRVAKAVETYHDQMDTSSLHLISNFLKQKKAWDPLITVLTYLKDYDALIQLYLQQEQYEKAFDIAKEHHLEALVYLPYAHHLALKDDFDGAQSYFTLAGRQDLAIQVLTQMHENATIQGQYLEAARLAWRLSKAFLLLVPSEKSDVSQWSTSEVHFLQKYHQYQFQADWLYAYHYVSKYMEEPFTSLSSMTLFQMARYLYMDSQSLRKRNHWPNYLSKVVIQLALIKLGPEVGAHTTASHLASQLVKSYSVPLEYQCQLDGPCLRLKSKAHVLPPDDSALSLVCCGCSVPNSVLSDHCVACNTPFIWSFHTFDLLPLIPFIVSESPDAKTFDSLSLDVSRSSTESTNATDASLLSVLSGCSPGKKEIEIHPDSFSKLPPPRLFKILSPHPTVPTYYYYKVFNHIPITLCDGCHRLFHMDDYEYLTVLNGNECPLCRKLSNTC